ncbi:hypothetical protein CYMTET_8220 [Cymbomonas tetramitiformis]|uniref:Uncharacterized protein n=1 Tax=Cymbomonas tetramitiformis TaxID=36881 RepID=A0AAE0LGA6_9CHLO|nr:hypothetical protein CYMTET_8220 [Cymbomonas tetramitiformis]
MPRRKKKAEDRAKNMRTVATRVDAGTGLTLAQLGAYSSNGMDASEQIAAANLLAFADQVDVPTTEETPEVRRKADAWQQEDKLSRL